MFFLSIFEYFTTTFECQRMRVVDWIHSGWASILNHSPQFYLVKQWKCAKFKIVFRKKNNFRYRREISIWLVQKLLASFSSNQFLTLVKYIRDYLRHFFSSWQRTHKYMKHLHLVLHMQNLLFQSLLFRFLS